MKKNRHKILDIRHKTKTLRSLGLVLIALVGSFQFSFSQGDSTTGIIKLRQRLVHIKHDEGKEAVDSFRILHVMIGGNVYQTEKHLNYAYDEKTKKYDFRNEFKYIQPILNLGDLSIVNLKTSFGNNVKNMFSAPDEFALALKYAGINVAMHANIHTANISKSMLKRTRDLLNTYDMYHTGAFTDNMQRNGNYPLIINKKGFRIAVLNYTRVTNRPSISRDFIINEIDKFTIERDMRMALAQKPDFIIAYFDWGANNQETPNYMQMDIVQYAFQLGANMVVGTNPNTPMRIDYNSYNRNGQMKEGIVAYSLGNLIASNDDVKNRKGYLIDLELKKNNFTGETDVNDWGAIPVYTYYDTTSAHGATKVFAVPCSNVESGDIFPNIPYIEKRRAVNCAYDVRKLLGATADEIQYNLNELIVNNVQETIDITSASLNNKFSQKRASEIEPSDAPVLPMATLGSNNPPSIAVLYEEPIKPETSLGKQYPKAKSILDNVPQVSTLPSKPINGNAPNLYPQATDSITRKTSTDVLNNESVALKIPSADTSATNPVVAENKKENKKSSAKEKNVAEKKADVVVANNDSTKIAAVAKNKNASNDSSSIAKSNKQSNENLLAEKDSVNRKSKTTVADASTAKSKTKNQPANTNYHTIGNDYELKEKEAAVAKQKKAAAETKEREKETSVEIHSNATENIAAKNTSGINSEIKMINGANSKVVLDTFYRIQFYALKKFIPLDTNYYTHLKGYEVLEEDGLFKYLLGKFKTNEECEQYWKTQIQPRYKQSFISKYVSGKRILQ